MKLHPLIKQELEYLTLQFPNQPKIDLDAYADLYKIGRRNASQHLRRRGIPYTKEGKSVYISLLDLATYKASCKISTDNPLIKPFASGIKEEMKSRRGFSKMAMSKQLK